MKSVANNVEHVWQLTGRRKKVKFPRIFRGKFLEKSAVITREIFGGKLRQESISRNQLISLDFFWQISLKSNNLASTWPALFNVFLTGKSFALSTTICSRNERILKLLTLWLVRSFSQHNNLKMPGSFGTLLTRCRDKV